MNGTTAYMYDNSALGYYRVFAKPNGSDVKYEITFFRDSPINIGNISHADPFGDKSLSFTVNSATVYDTPGTGDLSWLSPWSQIEVVWQVDENADAVTSRLLSNWKWEGVIASWSFSQNETTGNISVECVGALYILDNMLAIPFYPTRPIPKEILIRKIMDRAHDYHYGLGEFSGISSDTSPTELEIYRSSDYQYTIKNPAYLNDGDLWSGSATRDTGQRDKALTGFINQLLSDMYSKTGKQWTLMNLKDRKSVLKVRKYYDEIYADNNKTNEEILYIDALTPGVTINLTQDFSQTANVVYGTGSSSEGKKFTSPNGDYIFSPQGQNSSSYFYTEQIAQPFSFEKTVHPISNNPELNTNFLRKEANVDFTTSLDALQAKAVADRQLAIMKDAGYTGTINIKVDPHLGNDFAFPRYLIQAGQSIIVYFGNTGKRVIFNIAECSLNIESGEVSLTVDSKRRDLITLQEVHARAYDALNMKRALSIAGISNDIPQQDILLPWNPSTSGIFPQGKIGKIVSKKVWSRDLRKLITKKVMEYTTYNGANLFKIIDNANEVFPWTNVTEAHPPTGAYANSYIKKGVASASNPNKNWVGPIPILLSSQGNIGLTQIAAYYADGTIAPVEFHVSLYYEPSVSASAMPQIFTRIQSYLKPIKSSKYSSGYVFYTFKEKHGVPLTATDWLVAASSLTHPDTTPAADWSTTAVALIPVDEYTVKWAKATSPTGIAPNSGSATLSKTTKPKQRTTTGASINCSEYTISFNATKQVYLVMMKIQGSGPKAWQDFVSYAGAPIVTTGFTNAVLNGSFTTVNSGISGYIAYQVDATAGAVQVGNFPNSQYPETIKISSGTTGYQNGAYPFFEYAFETRFEDGTTIDSDISNAQYAFPTVALVVGWGNYWQPAGYGNGLYTTGAQKTGTLIDQDSWSYNTETYASGVNAVNYQQPAANAGEQQFGIVYAMIYCDDNAETPVYFLGRMWPDTRSM